jgi:hypothetical protein
MNLGLTEGSSGILPLMVRYNPAANKIAGGSSNRSHKS